VRQDEEFYFAENKTLQLVGTGHTLDEAVDDFREHLDYFRTYYSQIHDFELTCKAKNLKQAFARL